jgi:hypothetical protein
MKKIIKILKDATLYQAFPDRNAGLDEILEVGKLADAMAVSAQYSASSARAIVFFDATPVNPPESARYILNLKLANATDIPRGQTIEIAPIVTDWEEGSGYLYQDIQNVNDGATWTSAKKDSPWTTPGGDVNTTLTHSIALNEYPLRDLRIEITSLVASSSQGLMLKFPSLDEQDVGNVGNLKVFSSQTHTIHQPTVEIVWDDQIFTTGSLRPIPNVTDIKVSSQNLRESYTHGEVSRINLIVRDEYPLRTFDATLRYKSRYYLPETTYVSIRDVQANVEVISFDEYSKVNCDEHGVYFVLDTSPLYKKRIYDISIKIVASDGVRYIQPSWTFQVI